MDPMTIYFEVKMRMSHVKAKENLSVTKVEGSSLSDWIMFAEEYALAAEMSKTVCICARSICVYQYKRDVIVIKL